MHLGEIMVIVGIENHSFRPHFCWSSGAVNINSKAALGLFLNEGATARCCKEGRFSPVKPDIFRISVFGPSIPVFLVARSVSLDSSVE